MKHICESIYSNYLNCWMRCTVYNLRFFDSEKPFNQELQNAVERLTGFLIAYDRLPLSAVDAPTSAQWLTLIKSGYYYYDAFEIRSSDYDDNIDRYLKSPNRILFCAVLMQLNMLFERAPKRYLLTDTGAYSLKKLSNSLYTALCSKQAILRDLLIWGGINVCLDRDHVNSMREAFHVWSVWHRNESLKYQGLMKYLRYPESQNAVLKELTPFSASAVKLNLSNYEFDAEKSPELEGLKKRLFSRIPILREKWGEPEQLSDFQYALILYCIFRVLRDNMCVEAYEICTKILDNNFLTPYISSNKAFAMLFQVFGSENDISGGEESR